MAEQDTGEKMIPLSAVAPLLDRFAMSIAHGPAVQDLIDVWLYDHAAAVTGHPRVHALMATRLGSMTRPQ